jgi:hypothetical protein
MSSQPIHKSSHPEKLLPWYVNRTLSESEKKTVETHLFSCNRCQKEVALLEKMRMEVQNTPVSSPGEFGLHRLLKDIRQDKARQQKQKRVPSWLGTALAIAASFIIILQAGLLMDMWVHSPAVEPLGESTIGITLQVSFASTTTEADIRKMLLEINGTFIGGPGQLGIYRIQLPFSEEPHIAQIIDSLQQQTNFVTHVARE